MARKKVGSVTFDFKRGCPVCGGHVDEVRLLTKTGLRVFEPLEKGAGEPVKAESGKKAPGPSDGPKIL